MGNLKVTKTKRASTRGKSGIPNWLLTTIVAIVFAAVILTCLVYALRTTGLILRYSPAMESENFKVSGSMMTYYYANTYNNFTNQYSQFLTNFSIGSGTPITEHRNIMFGGDANSGKTYYDVMFLGEFKGTWFDYFMKQTQESVKNMLIFCEEAKSRGIELTDEEKQSIDSNIAGTIMEVKTQYLIQNQYGISDSACIKMMYGEGVSKGDVRKAMELSLLAQKCQEAMLKEIDGTITDATIDEKYNADKLSYNLTDYFYYRFNIAYQDVAKELLGEEYSPEDMESHKTEIDQLFKQKVETAKEKLEELKTKTNLEDFKAFVVEYVANNNYDNILAQMIKDKELKGEKEPSEEDKDHIKAEMIATVIKEINEDKKTEFVDDVKKNEDGTYTLYEKTITEEYAAVATEVKKELFTSVNNVISNNNLEKQSYEKDKELSKWAFGDNAKVNDVKVITDSASKDEKTESKDLDKDSYYRENVYILTKTQYKDEEKSRNLLYALFSTEDDAKKAIEALIKEGSITKEKFEEVVRANSATGNTYYENYLEGDLQNTDLDKWLYGENAGVGSLTAQPIFVGEGVYLVGVYESEGEPCWKVEIRNDISEERYNAKVDEMTVKYAPSVKTVQWVIDRIAK